MKKPKPAHNPNLIEPLVALKKLMDDIGCPWTLIGGIAAGILGKPRFTADVDAVVSIKNEEITVFLKNAKKYGLVPRINNPEDFAVKNRVILLKHFLTGIGLDISLGLLPFEMEAIKGSRSYKIGDVSIRLPKAEDLIIFKAVAHRPQDMLDIQEIIKLHPKLDKKYLKKHLAEFAAILENPGIWKDIESLLLQD